MPQLEKSEVSTFWKDSSRDVEPESSGFVALQLLIAEERNNALSFASRAISQLYRL